MILLLKLSFVAEAVISLTTRVSFRLGKQLLAGFVLQRIQLLHRLRILVLRNVRSASADLGGLGCSESSVAVLPSCLRVAVPFLIDRLHPLDF